MIRRLLKPLKSNSFFIFGARATGKSTFIEQQFLGEGASCYRIDLLDADEEARFSRQPSLLERVLDGLPVRPEWVFIDEVQKAPRLLDQVHRLIEKTGQKFILSGSSARKLKRDGANLLAGRAFVNHLHPLTAEELREAWSLEKALNWGTLPRCWSLRDDDERRAYLKSYVHTYLREEIQIEQLVRRLDPFRSFLEVSAQMNGKVVNHSRIAREVGVTDKTIQSYFQILEDTLLGFVLPPFHRPIRKAQANHPKFYWFDTGVKRQLERSLSSPLVPSTSAYGEAFEHLVILETLRRADYRGKDWTFSFFRTKEGNEIDLVISLDRKRELLVEIKSTSSIDPTEVRALERLTADFHSQGTFYLSLDPHPQVVGKVRCLPWLQGIDEILRIP